MWISSRERIPASLYVVKSQISAKTGVTGRVEIHTAPILMISNHYYFLFNVQWTDGEVFLIYQHSVLEAHPALLLVVAH